MHFTRLADGMTGNPVFIPKNVEVVAIRTDDPANDTFWLEYIWSHNTTPPTTRSIRLKGPIDAILDALEAETTGSDTKLRARVKQLEEEGATLRTKLAESKAAYAEAVSELGLFKTLEVREKWTDVKSMGVPTLYSTFRYRVSPPNSGSEMLGLFQAAMGQLGQGFTHTYLRHAHTNLFEGGRVPNSQTYHVFGVKVELIGGSDELATWLRNTSVLRWDFRQTVNTLAPLGAFDWEGRVGYLRLGEGSIECDADAVPRQRRVEKGEDSPSLFALRRNGVELPGGGTFSLKLTIDCRTTPESVVGETIDIRVSLAGYYLEDIEVG